MIDMRVRELIEQLKNCDPDYDVLLYKDANDKEPAHLISVSQNKYDTDKTDKLKK